MASLLFPDERQGQWPTTPTELLAPPDERPPLLQPDTRADALGQTYQAVMDRIAAEQAKAQAQGLWEGGQVWEGGHPTRQGLLALPKEWADAVAFGTTSSGGKPSFNVYHGSPHKFDPTPKNPLGEFRDSAIGTGEGGQAYGMGHYAGEAEAVGLRYRDLLAAKFQSPEKTAVEDAILKEIAAGNEKAAALEAKGFDYMSPEVTAATAPREQAVKALQDKLSAIPPTKGHVYEVRVNADQERFLNWDKPLSEQHPDVVKALKNTPYPPHDMRMSVKDYMAALETNREMATKSGDPAALASQALKEAGIPGIRYLDQDSRSAGHGTRNVVVFDPAIMEIIRRYGLAGLMLGGGGLLAPNRQER